MGGDCLERDKYYLDLVTQDLINYNGLIIYQPSFNDIKKIGIDTYNQIMQIYTLTLDCFENVSDEADIFEDILLQNESLFNCLCESLRILTKPSEMYIDFNTKSLKLVFSDNKHTDDAPKVDVNEIPSIKHKSLYELCLKILNKIFKKDINIETTIQEEEKEELRYFIINSSNFDDISEIILKINSNRKAQIEKPPANMSERQRDIWEKLQEGRRRDSKKNDIHIYDILNVCEFGGDYHIPIDTITSWSLWRILNCYKARIGWKNYDDNLQIALVSGDGKPISGNNHWHQQLMIRE